MNIIRDSNGNYSMTKASKEDIVRLATEILERNLEGQVLTSPKAASEYLVCKLGQLERECFAVIFLRSHCRKWEIIAYEELFYGTINGAEVHPREIAKRALEFNAAAVILAHNHPSGTTEPSEEDVRVTKRIQSALALLDVQVLDHIIVGGAQTYSFTDGGLI